MPNYGKTAESAYLAISRNGSIIGCTREVSGQYDPVSGEDPQSVTTAWDIVAVKLPATIARFRGIDNKLVEDGSLNLAKARYLLTAAKDASGGFIPEPLPEDLVSFDGGIWRVVGATPIKPAGVAILYQIGVVLIG